MPPRGRRSRRATGEPSCTVDQFFSKGGMESREPSAKESPPPRDDASNASGASGASQGMKREMSSLLSAALSMDAGSRPRIGPESAASSSDGPLSKVAKARAIANAATVPAAGGDSAQALVTSPSGKCSMLNDDASAMFRKLSAKAHRSLMDAMHELPATIRVASACSGTDVWHQCCEVLVDIAGSAAMVPLSLESAFVCEKTPFKQRYLLGLDHVAESPCCCFSDLMELSKEKAFCAKHGGLCRVPRDPLWWSCGFSCCPYSKLNPKANQNKEALSELFNAAWDEEAQVEGGLETAVGNFRYMLLARPLFSWLENVDDLDDELTCDKAKLADAVMERNSNLEVLKQAFEKEGVMLVPLIVDAAEYGLPQVRVRLIMTGVPVDHPLLAESPSAPIVTNQMSGLLETFKIPMKDFMDCVLSADDPAVVAELARLTEVHKQSKQKQKDTKWQTDHEEYFRSLGFRWGAVRGSEQLRNSEWFKVLPAREKDICVLNEALNSEVRRVDCSQSIHRARPSSKSFSFTVTPGMRQWDFRLMRPLIGRECMKLQGIDWENIKSLGSFSETELGDLAGNAFASNAMLAVMLATMVAIPLRNDENGDDVRVGDLVSALGSERSKGT